MFPVMMLKKPANGGWTLYKSGLQEKQALHDMYKLIGCELVDVRTVEIDGTEFDVWFDEEFLLKNKPVPNLLLPDGTVLCGKVLFAKHDADGATVGLTKEDERTIENWLPSRIKALIDWLKKQ